MYTTVQKRGRLAKFAHVALFLRKKKVMSCSSKRKRCSGGDGGLGLGGHKPPL